MVVLIAEDSLHSCHVDVRLLLVGLYVVCKVPSLYLSFHSSIFLFKVPDACFERTVFIFSLVDEALEGIVLVPDNVLSSHVAVEVDVGVKDVVVGIYLFSELLFVANAFVKLLLPSFEGLVMAT